MPLFSIVVPSYNNAAYLTECINSIRKQEESDWEIIVVDDASNDNSLNIAQELATQDSRIRVIAKPSNQGLHLARRTGVASASGTYILFLDADDALTPGCLRQLKSVCSRTDAEIIQFGMICVARDNMDNDTARAFEQWANGEDYSLNRSHLLAAVYAQMTDIRLERAEDSYEFLVLASNCNYAISCIGIRGYQYNIGRGITNSNRLSLEDFKRSVQQMHECCIATEEYASQSKESLLLRSAASLRKRLIFAVMNEWYERVSEEDKPDAAIKAADSFLDAEIAEELLRFTRDDAYSHLGLKVSGDEPFFTWYKIAQDLVNNSQNMHKTRRFRALENEAATHIAELQGNASLREEYESEDIPIFASIRSDIDRFDTKIIQPVHAGAARTHLRFPYSFRDDEGLNISDKNPMYCELTTQYWAWKNVTAEYYGFCHYNRYFDFSSVDHTENQRGEIDDTYINQKAANEYAIHDSSIREAVSQFDIVTTPFRNIAQYDNGQPTTTKPICSL